MVVPASHCLQLHDGRLLSYTETGKLDGRPVLYFHGIPGSRLEQHPQPEIAKALGLRLLTPERPGYGYSTPQPGRRLVDWPSDITEFADHLGISDFAVIGFSGGGPYALACAHNLPQRISSVTLVSSPSPYTAIKQVPENLALFELARDDPQQAATILEDLAGDGERLYQLMIDSLPEEERGAMHQPELAAIYRENMHEAVRQGISGMVQDMAIIASDWGFSVEKLTCPVQLWHGLSDGLTPPVMAHYLNERLPRCHGHFLPAQGHFLLYRHWHEILVYLHST
jgi:pimeloyl-ACP methyl ester carboxylesterase